jgi:site-specific recombinase XerD
MDNPTLLGPWVRRFLLDYMAGERNLARNTQRSYRDTLTLLLPFVATAQGTAVDRLTVEQVAPEVIRRFLRDLETTRACSIATRNQRLAAIHAMARFISAHSPEHIAWCGAIRDIPFKKAPQPVMAYLEKDEMEALLAAPDQTTAQGQRDYAVLLFLYNTGARASETTNVSVADLALTHTPSVKLWGKGNKSRYCPLWPLTVYTLVALIGDREPHCVRLPQSLAAAPHALWAPYAGGALCAQGVGTNARIGGQARESPYDPTYDSRSSLAGRGRHQHDPGLVGTCVP